MLFSTKDKLIASLIFLIPPTAFNLSMHFLQDIVLTLAIHIFLVAWFVPFIIHKITGKDPTTLLTYKNLLTSDKRGKKFNLITFVLLCVTVALNILTVWFGFASGFNSIVFPAPFFSSLWINYIYLALTLVAFMVAIQMEHKLYYGVVSTFLPDNMIGFLGIALYQTTHYIALAFILMNSDSFAGILIVLLFGLHLTLYILKEKETYKSSTLAHQIVALANLALLAVFVGLKYHGEFRKGVGLIIPAPKNFINRLIH